MRRCRGDASPASRLRRVARTQGGHTGAWRHTRRRRGPAVWGLVRPAGVSCGGGRTRDSLSPGGGHWIFFALGFFLMPFFTIKQPCAQLDAWVPWVGGGWRGTPPGRLGPAPAGVGLIRLIRSSQVPAGGPWRGPPGSRASLSMSPRSGTGVALGAGATPISRVWVWVTLGSVSPQHPGVRVAPAPGAGDGRAHPQASSPSPSSSPSVSSSPSLSPSAGATRSCPWGPKRRRQRRGGTPGRVRQARRRSGTPGAGRRRHSAGK